MDTIYSAYKKAKYLTYDVEWIITPIFHSNREKNLYLTHALPGSGKTILAECICDLQKDKYDACNFSTDDYFGDNGTYIFNREKLGVAHLWNQNRARFAIDSGISCVIISNTNLTAKEVRPYLEMGAGVGYNVWCIEPIREGNDDLEKLFERNIHGVPMESLVRMKNRMQPTQEFCEKCRAIIDNYLEDKEYNQLLPSNIMNAIE